MTDMRRTLLWVVFTMSLVLIWDAWNRHNGQPTLFGAPVARSSAAASAPPSAAAAALPQASGAVTPAGAVPATPAVATAAAPAAGEKVELTTDLYKASFDSVGGSLVRLELLRQPDQNDRSRNVVLFDHSAKRSYSAQTGLITADAGVALPNHLTPMTVLPGARARADGRHE